MSRMAEKIKIMEDNRKEQTEALETLLKFNGRLINNMQIIVKELSGNRLEDTDKFLKLILDAMNWEIQVVNGTMEVLNEGKERVSKEVFNNAVIALSDAVKANDDTMMVKAFATIIPVFEKLGESVKEVIK